MGLSLAGGAKLAIAHLTHTLLIQIPYMSEWEGVGGSGRWELIGSDPRLILAVMYLTAISLLMISEALYKHN